MVPFRPIEVAKMPCLPQPASSHVTSPSPPKKFLAQTGLLSILSCIWKYLESFSMFSLTFFVPEQQFHIDTLLCQQFLTGNWVPSPHTHTSSLRPACDPLSAQNTTDLCATCTSCRPHRGRQKIEEAEIPQHSVGPLGSEAK